MMEMISSMLSVWSPPNLMDLITKEEPTLTDLAIIISFLAVGIALIFEVSKPGMIALARSSLLMPLMRKVADREWGRSDKKDECELFNITTKEDFLERGVIENFVMWILVGCQHFIGGLLCIPSTYYSMTGKTMCDFTTSTSTSLACLGILLEAGFDLQDFLVTSFKRLFFKNGKDLFPNLLFFVLIIHHSTALIGGTMMILHYRDLPDLHRLCLNLQGAAGLGVLFQQVGRLLDVTNPTQLVFFKYKTFFCWLFSFGHVGLIGIILLQKSCIFGIKIRTGH